MKVAVILPAAGRGTRMAKTQADAGPASRKQFLQLEGVPILLHTIRKFARCGLVDEIVVAMDDRRVGFPIRDLLECKRAGVAVIDLLSFLERETGKERCPRFSRRFSWSR